MGIGQKIKQKRSDMGMSQRDLAERMGYSNHSTIARIESGKVDIPQSKIVQFAEVLGTTVGWLMDWEEVQKKNDTLSSIVVRLRTDADFYDVVNMLHNMDTEQLVSTKQFLGTLFK